MNQCLEHNLPIASATDHDAALVELGRYLRRVGYEFTAVTPLTHHYYNQRQSHTQGHSHNPGHSHNQRQSSHRTPHLRNIFGWNCPFEQAQVSTDELELMQRAGILVQQNATWRSKVRWSSLGSMICAHSAYPTDAQNAVFFGPDTYRFARLIEPWLQVNKTRVGRAVDIGCGSGAGALLVAKACPGAEVLAVDINREALRLTAINAELAEADNVVPVYSNLLGDVVGEFDLIIANPPYMLDSLERDYRHGGGELGAELSVRIVDTALSRLVPGGTLLLYTGVAMVDGTDPFLATLKQQLNGRDCEWHYSEMDPDVFSDELLKPAYRQVERIAAVQLTLQRTMVCDDEPTDQY